MKTPKQGWTERTGTIRFELTDDQDRALNMADARIDWFDPKQQNALSAEDILRRHYRVWRSLAMIGLLDMEESKGIAGFRINQKGQDFLRGKSVLLGRGPRSLDRPLEYEVPTKYGMVGVTGLFATLAKKGGDDLKWVIDKIETARDFTKEMKMDKPTETDLEQEYYDTMLEIGKLGGNFNGVKLLALLSTFQKFSEVDKTILIHRTHMLTLLPVDFLTSVMASGVYMNQRDDHDKFVKWFSGAYPDGVQHSNRNDLYLAFRAGWNSALNPIPDTLTKD